ncbi:MAG TPA: mannose-1-phosphate guanylyltransferase [Polyangia bacterium]|jgi:mannose-1-phosphate guanylyltransferase|nr:mannose-1-phosphate guanylyltransferase [Polyangia bacterium]
MVVPWIVILAGGGGTRLWPLSRRRRPKQFLPLVGSGETLLGATVRRLAPLAPLERVLVVTAASQADDVLRAVPNLPPDNLIVEPIGRNTAPAIGLAAIDVIDRDPDGVMAVIPSDQFVSDEAGFRDAVMKAVRAAAEGQVVTIGIRPTRPETGYGYIQRGAPLQKRPGDPQAVAGPEGSAAGALYAVARFVEKPDRQTAERYLAAGDYLWNAGMFFFPARRILAEIQAQLPALGEILEGVGRDSIDLVARYPSAPAISIDYAVMEGLPGRSGMAVVPGDFGWSDVGSWDALAELRPADAHGNTVLGEAVTIDAHNNVLVGDRLIAAVGVRDLVIVATDQAVLILPRSRAQDVRQVVSELERTGRDILL